MENEEKEFASIVAVGPDLSVAAGQDLVSVVSRSAGNETCPVILDLNRVEHLGSTGVGSLIELLKAARRSDRRIVGFGAREQTRQVLQITHLDRYLPLYQTRGEALSSIGLIADRARAGQAQLDR